jgi:hypothetical protein
MLICHSIRHPLPSLRVFSLSFIYILAVTSFSFLTTATSANSQPPFCSQIWPSLKLYNQTITPPWRCLSNYTRWRVQIKEFFLAFYHSFRISFISRKFVVLRKLAYTTIKELKLLRIEPGPILQISYIFPAPRNKTFETTLKWKLMFSFVPQALFFIISRSVFFRMRNVSDKSCG